MGRSRNEEEWSRAGARVVCGLRCTPSRLPPALGPGVSPGYHERSGGKMQRLTHPDLILHAVLAAIMVEIAKHWLPQPIQHECIRLIALLAIVRYLQQLSDDRL